MKPARVNGISVGIHAMNRVVSLLALLILSTVLTACGQDPGQQSPPAPVTGLQIQGAGGTFPQPLYAKWIADNEKRHPDVHITYKGVGSGEGIKRFIAQSVDFGASDAAMSDGEMARVKRGAKLIPATAGMVVLAYNLPGVTGELRLPREAYLGIFAGRITRWDDPRIQAANQGLALPHKDIAVVVRREASGTTYAFINHLSALSPAWRNRGPGVGKLVDWPANTMTASGNEGVAQRVKISTNSIGYMEYGFAKRIGLPMAVLQNQAGQYIRPTPESGQAALAAAAPSIPANLRLFIPDPAGADSYPIVTLTWLLLYDSYPDAAKGDAIKQLVRWGLTEGQAEADGLGYIPLPAGIAAKARAALDGIR
jgi:phosphate transport system substrate-binding protein